MIGKKVPSKLLLMNAYYTLSIVFSFFVSYSHNYVDRDLTKQTRLQTFKLNPFFEQEEQSTKIKSNLLQDTNHLEDFDISLSLESPLESPNNSPIVGYERFGIKDFKCASFRRVLDRVICVPKDTYTTVNNNDADSKVVDYKQHQSSSRVLLIPDLNEPIVMRNNQSMPERFAPLKSSGLSKTDGIISSLEDNDYSRFLPSTRSKSIEDVVNSGDDKILKDREYSRWILEEEQSSSLAPVETAYTLNKIATSITGHNLDTYTDNDNIDTNNNVVNEPRKEFKTGRRRANLFEKKNYESGEKDWKKRQTTFHDEEEEAVANNIYLINQLSNRMINENEKRNLIQPFRINQAQYFDNKQIKNDPYTISIGNPNVIRSFGVERFGKAITRPKIDDMKRKKNKNIKFRNNPAKKSAPVSFDGAAKEAMQRRSKTIRLHRDGLVSNATNSTNQMQSTYNNNNINNMKMSSKENLLSPLSSPPSDIKNDMNLILHNRVLKPKYLGNKIVPSYYVDEDGGYHVTRLNNESNYNELSYNVSMSALTTAPADNTQEQTSATTPASPGLVQQDSGGLATTTSTTNNNNNVLLGCHKRLFRFKAVKSDGAGNKCFGWITSSVCYGSCDTGQFSDHVFPHKKSVHKVCTHGKRIQRRAILDVCTSQDVDSTLREYNFVDAGSCVCKSCSSLDTTCLGSLSTPSLN